jgi:hypothetical protein
MRKFLVAATFTAMTLLVPAAARAGFILEASAGKGYVVSTPRDWTQMNVMLAPGFASSLPVLSMIKFQLGIVGDIADKSGTKTDLQLRPMISVVPPILPLYGRVIFVFNNLLERTGKREIAYGGAVGARIGIPSITFVPAFGVFAEVGALPRNHEYQTEPTVTQSKMFWILEARAGAYLYF